VGLTYQFAERWKLDAAYQYTRTRYAQNSSEPRSNVVFVSVAYNWPGASFTSWLGNPAETQGLPGAGPMSSNAPVTGLPGASLTPELLPFDSLTLP
jgi:hypothetical protein